MTDEDLSYILSLANKKIQQSPTVLKLDVARAWTEAVIEYLILKGRIKE